MRLLLLLFAFALFSCSGPKTPPLLNTGVLPKQLFRINTARDTVVRTAAGALLKIGKGSLTGSDEAALEVREAYSFEDIVRAGLTTQSDGQPLRSGGMIYVNAVDKNIAIAKPIGVSLPTQDYDAGMKLFKGKEREGKINWVEPSALPETLSPYLTAGKKMFAANCAACHAYDKTLTGPAMAALESRGPWKNRTELYKFTHNPAGYIAHNCYAKNLAAQFNGQIMPSYPALGVDDMDAIYDYLRTEDLNRNVDLTNNYVVNPCEDSCRRFDSVRSLVQGRVADLQYRQKELLATKEDRINYTNADTTTPMPRNAGTTTAPQKPLAPGAGYVPIREKVVVPEYEARYYSFEIAAFGWCNIDRLMKLTDTDAVLVLNVDSSLSADWDVFMAVPNEKVFLHGGKLADGKGYGFDKPDGTLRLPFGQKVMVFALSERDGKILFDYREFISIARNQIALVPKEVSKAVLDEEIKKMALPGMTIQAKESKREQAKKVGEEIQQQNNLLEQWRPKKCNCNCFQTDSTNTAESTSKDVMEIIPAKK